MLRDDIEYCSNRIAEEERRARDAPGPEVGCVHLRMAMLYKAQLTSLLKNLPDEEVKELSAVFKWPGVSDLAPAKVLAA